MPNAHMGKWNHGSAQNLEKFVHEARSIARLGLASTEAKAKGQGLRLVLQVGLEGLWESESWSQAMCSFSLCAVDTPYFLHLTLLFHVQLRLHQSTKRMSTPLAYLHQAQSFMLTRLAFISTSINAPWWLYYT